MRKSMILRFRSLALSVLTVSVATSSSVFAANPADWRTFNSTAAQIWSSEGNWTAATGSPTSGDTLVINFDPSQAGTTTNNGAISSTFTSTNDLGTVTLNALHLSGSGNNSTTRTVTITGGTLQFEGPNASITNSTVTNSANGYVHYAVASNIATGTNLAFNLNGTGTTTLISAAGSTLSASSAGLKTITVYGNGIGLIGGNSASLIEDGIGQIGITMDGPGLLALGGANTFTGGVLINSGTVMLNSSSAGVASSLGTGTIRIGNTTGNASATLDLTKSVTFTNTMHVQAGSSGTKTIQLGSGNGTSTIGGQLVVDGDLTLRYSGGVGGSITVGTSSTLSFMNGAGTITTHNNGTGNIIFTGSNGGYTGTLIVGSGTTRINSANAFSASNEVAVAAEGTLALNNVTQTFAGLTNVSGSGGQVMNIGGNNRVLTLAGGGSYDFGGVITALNPANLSIVKEGSGTQIFSGSNTYDGTTTVSAGTLLINGNSSGANGDVTVNAAATLGGSGIIGGATTILSGGILSPGNSPGTLTFDDNLNINSGGIASFEAGDLVNVNGILNLSDNWTLSLTSGFQDGGTMTLFNYTTAGTFDLTPTFDLSGLGFIPTGPVFLTDTGSAIVLNGLSVVPEPATWALIIGGTLVLTLRRRRGGLFS